MGAKAFGVITAVAHAPQLFNIIVRGKPMKQARVFSSPSNFWTFTTILLHILSIIALII